MVNKNHWWPVSNQPPLARIISSLNFDLNPMYQYKQVGKVGWEDFAGKGDKAVVTISCQQL